MSGPWVRLIGRQVVLGFISLDDRWSSGSFDWSTGGVLSLVDNYTSTVGYHDDLDDLKLLLKINATYLQFDSVLWKIRMIWNQVPLEIHLSSIKTI